MLDDLCALCLNTERYVSELYVCIYLYIFLFYLGKLRKILDLVNDDDVLVTMQRCMEYALDSLLSFSIMHIINAAAGNHTQFIWL